MKRQVVTHFDVDGAHARVHGDKPMSPESKRAMRSLVGAVAAAARRGDFDKNVVHILVPNNAKEAPFADFTYCGIDLRTEMHTPVEQTTPAYWADDPGGQGLGHLNKGERWCQKCRAVQRQSTAIGAKR